MFLSRDFNLFAGEPWWGEVGPFNEVERREQISENEIWYPANLAFRIQVHHVLDC